MYLLISSTELLAEFNSPWSSAPLDPERVAALERILGSSPLLPCSCQSFRVNVLFPLQPVKGSVTPTHGVSSSEGIQCSVSKMGHTCQKSQQHHCCHVLSGAAPESSVQVLSPQKEPPLLLTTTLKGGGTGIACPFFWGESEQMICWQSRSKQFRVWMLSILWLSATGQNHWFSRKRPSQCRPNHLPKTPTICLNDLVLSEL